MRKKAQLQLINAAAKLNASETGLQRIPSETDIADTEVCQVAIDGRHSGCQATGELARQGSVRQGRFAAIFASNIAAPTSGDSTEAAYALVATPECSENCARADAGFETQRRFSAVETSSLTSLLPDMIVCVEKYPHTIGDVTDSFVSNDNPPHNSSYCDMSCSCDVCKGCDINCCDSKGCDRHCLPTTSQTEERTACDRESSCSDHPVSNSVAPPSNIFYA